MFVSIDNPYDWNKIEFVLRTSTQLKYFASCEVAVYLSQNIFDILNDVLHFTMRHT